MLIIGKNKTPILEHLPSTFLIIDDGDFIDQLSFPKRRKITRLDFKKHSFDPLKNMDYRRARAFIQILDATFPEGANTLTKKNSNFVMLKALLDTPKRLDKLIEGNDPAEIDARQKIETLLFSPVLKDFLTRPTNFSFKDILIARLNRAELGDFDCFVLANLLINNYQGHVVIPDYGTYACPFHLSLIRQNRLTVGVNFLSELPQSLRNAFLLGHTAPSQCTFEDAETLANTAGVAAGTTSYGDFIYAAMR